MENINKAWDEMVAKLHALTLRERGMVLGALIAAIYGPWDALFNTSTATEHKRLTKSLSEVQAQVNEVNRSIAEVLVNSKRDPNIEIRNKLQYLDNELRELNVRKDQLAKSFMSPQSMADLLRDLLKNRASLRLTQMKTLPAKTVELTGQQAASAAQIAKSTQTPETNTKNDAVPVIYRHDLEIEFEGGYFDILEYLRAPELQSLFWDAISYRVDKYPKAKVVLKVYTLSFEQAWLGA